MVKLTTTLNYTMAGPRSPTDRGYLTTEKQNFEKISVVIFGNGNRSSSLDYMWSN